MAYWGLARATEGDRAADFLREAVKRKDKVTERERLYIEAEEAVRLPDPVRDTGGNRDERALRRAEMKKLETLCVKYPDDMEARALLAEVTMGDSRYGAELIIRGAHHYRIHNWDYHEPEQALASCRAYTGLVPGIGHARGEAVHADQSHLSVQQLELRAQPHLPFVYTGTAWHGGGGHLRRAASRPSSGR